MDPPITRSSRGSGVRAPKVPKVEVEDVSAIHSSRDLVLQVQTHALTPTTTSLVRPPGSCRACKPWSCSFKKFQHILLPPLFLAVAVSSHYLRASVLCALLCQQTILPTMASIYCLQEVWLLQRGARGNVQGAHCATGPFVSTTIAGKDAPAW